MLGGADFSGGVEPFTFDQRPGALEATRPARALLVVGSRATPGWTVLVAVRGEDGTFCQVALTAADARRAAAELEDMADVLEGIVW